MSNNPEQTFAYEIFKNATENGNIINLIVTGPEGTGKSKVLNSCRELITSIEQICNLLVGAYTGMAASNVNGELICKRLYLTPSIDRKRKERNDGNFRKIWKSILSETIQISHIYLLINTTYYV